MTNTTTVHKPQEAAAPCSSGLARLIYSSVMGLKMAEGAGAKGRIRGGISRGDDREEGAVGRVCEGKRVAAEEDKTR